MTAMMKEKHKQTLNPEILSAKIYRLKDVPAKLGVSRSTVIRAINSGKLRATKTSYHCVVVTADDISAYLENFNR